MWRLLLLASAPAVLGSADKADPSSNFDHELEALDLDDQCAAHDSDCALNALQLRGVKVANQAEDELAESQPIWHYALPCWHACHGAGNCPTYCGPGNACCKNPSPTGPPECQNVGFWPVYGFHTCVRAGSPAVSPVSPIAPAPSPAGDYKLDWSAEGESFFSGFDFMWRDDNHGSAQYMPTYDKALEAGVVEAYGTHAILRTGKASSQYQWKRQSAKIATNKSWKHFLAMMKFSHVPYGCGVWPALFTLAPEYPWPDGGEVDILEYVNTGNSRSSFHTAEDCTLKPEAFGQYLPMPDLNRMDYACKTAYPKHLGCAPNKWERSGKAWSHSPGVIALERTEDYLKIFAIPEAEIPADIESDAPNPDSWDRWLFAFYPFTASGCSKNVMQAQQLVMQINMCGDWAGKVFGDDHKCHAKTGWTNKCRNVDPLAEYAPEEDCCTQFIWDEDGKYGTDDYLAETAFFNISYMKVYQRPDAPPTETED